MINLIKTLVYIIITFFTSLAFGQVDKDSNLQQQSAQKEIFLNNADNETCDASLLKDLFTDDFEFYDDKVALTTGRDAFLIPMKENLEQNVKRELSYDHQLKNNKI